MFNLTPLMLVSPGGNTTSTYVFTVKSAMHRLNLGALTRNSLNGGDEDEEEGYAV